eukprot:c17783_g2_i1.p1 GENE.c17783_g2_i1~~c17783_g2_i1.p1  ORF type:complete len:236 (+),score=48.17 c17783_g2_i1:26-709(+)
MNDLAFGGELPEDSGFYHDLITMDWLTAPIFVKCECFEKQGRYHDAESLAQLITSSFEIAVDNFGNKFTPEMSCPACRKSMCLRTMARSLNDQRAKKLGRSLKRSEKIVLDTITTVDILEPFIDNTFAELVNQRKIHDEPQNVPTGRIATTKGELKRKLLAEDPRFAQEERDRELLQNSEDFKALRSDDEMAWYSAKQIFPTSFLINPQETTQNGTRRPGPRSNALT